MKINKIFMAILAIMCSLQNVMATSANDQSKDAAPIVFEGVVKAIRTNNLDKNVSKVSGGFGYNGATKFTYFFKGNKALAVDSTLHYSTVYDPEAGTVTVFGHYNKEGIVMPWNEYDMILKSWSNKPRYFKSAKLPAYDVYDATLVNGDGMVLNYPSKLYKVNFELHGLASSRNEIDVEVLPQFMLSESASGAISNCLEVDGLPVRIKAVMEARVFGKLKSYLGLEVVEIDPDFNLPDSLFQVPADIKLKKKGAGKLNSFLKGYIKYLKANNLYPKDDEVVYELKDEDWLY